MAIAVVLSIVALVLTLAAAVVTLPRWCIRSLHRHRLWRLRDRIADDMIEGVLPKDHPAVVDLLGRTEMALFRYSDFTLLNVTIMAMLHIRSSRSVQREILAIGAECSTAGLSEHQTELVRGYRAERLNLLAGSVLTGSWLGMAFVVSELPRVAKKVMVDGVVAVARTATDDAVQYSWLGKATKRSVRHSRLPHSPLIHA